MERLELEDNNLQGTLPPELSSTWTVLEIFLVNNNSFTGLIPTLPATLIQSADAVNGDPENVNFEQHNYPWTCPFPVTSTIDSGTRYSIPSNKLGVCRCPVGSFCPNGKERNNVGQCFYNCTACPRGSFGNHSNADQCYDCPLGRSTNFTGTAMNCSSCDKGRFADVKGMTACDVCAVLLHGAA